MADMTVTIKKTTREKAAKPARKTKPTSSTAPTKKPDELPAITTVEYGGLQAAFSFLNNRLFDGALENVVIVLQRRAHSGGHFAPDRFTRRAGDGGHHEISLNPDGFVGQTDEYIVSILLHEIHAGANKTPPSKVKFTCPSCGSNMWGKPDSKDICGECNQWRKIAASTVHADFASYDREISSEDAMSLIG